LRYAIISDIHGNIQALESVLGVINNLEVDRVICLGDVVGYGAKPVECISLIRETCDTVLLGNHDAAAIEKCSVDYFNPAARSAIEWTRKVLSGKDVEYLDSLPYLYKGEAFTATHATYSNPENWGYIFSAYEADIEFNVFEMPLLFYGHTHYPVVFSLGSENVDSQYVSGLSLDGELRYLINVGSVGQPRDGNPDACFLTYDQEEVKIEYHRVPYDIEGSQRDIMKTGIPRELALRLSIGR